MSRHYTSQQRLDIGRVVIEARGNDVDWKILEQQFDRDRTRLYRYAMAALSGGEQQTQHNSSKTQHLDDCETEAA